MKIETVLFQANFEECSEVSPSKDVKGALITLWEYLTVQVHSVREQLPTVSNNCVFHTYSQPNFNYATRFTNICNTTLV